MAPPSRIASDLIWGVPEIAAAINRTPRAVYHLMSQGALPAQKVGGRWVVSQAKLLAYLAGEAPGA